MKLYYLVFLVYIMVWKASDWNTFKTLFGFVSTWMAREFKTPTIICTTQKRIFRMVWNETEGGGVEKMISEPTQNILLFLGFGLAPVIGIIVGETIQELRKKFRKD